MEPLIARVRAVVSDRDSGASEVVGALLPLLEEARAAGADAVLAAVRLACAEQPSMAPVWNACAAALADLAAPGRLARFRHELAHQQRGILRIAGDAVLELISAPHKATPARLPRRGPRQGVPSVVTWSYSGTVAAVLAQVAARQPFTVVCAEGRPRLEGRRLAATLGQSGAHVILTTDAAATSRVEGATAVVVGADAVMADRWINKVGTRALAAAAAGTGCPVVVVATRDKAVAPVLAARLDLGTGSPAEVWDDPPTGVEIVSPIFESVPAELATWFATDVGLLTSADLPTFVHRNEAEIEALISAL